MGEAEETQTHLQTQADCQTQTQTQKKVSTDSVEPTLCKTLLHKGVMPVIICGQHKASFNYAIHADDCLK